MSVADVPQLVFRIMRLSPPRLYTGTGLRLELESDMVPDRGATPHRDADPLTHHDGRFARRVDLGHTAGGIPGLAMLPSSFGQVHLGQTLNASISLCNMRSAISQVGIKIDVQTDSSKVTLHDTTSSPYTSVPLGGRVEVTVQMDIRELGQHTITCSSFYTDGAGQRHFYPQIFRFVVTNPLSVRTKHRRTSGDAALLEVTLENRTRLPILLSSLDFLPEPGFAVRSITNADASPDVTKALEGGPLSDYANSMVELDPEGGSWSSVFHIRGTPPPSSASRDSGEATLGRVDIRWCGCMGEPAHLQTQPIAIQMSCADEFEIALGPIPSGLVAGRPFVVRAAVTSRSPHPSPLLTVVPGPTTGSNPGVVLEGHQRLPVGQIGPMATAHVDLELLPVAQGQQVISSFLLVSNDGSQSGSADHVLHSTFPTEIFVAPPLSSVSTRVVAARV